MLPDPYKTNNLPLGEGLAELFVFVFFFSPFSFQIFKTTVTPLLNQLKRGYSKEDWEWQEYFSPHGTLKYTLKGLSPLKCPESKMSAYWKHQTLLLLALWPCRWAYLSELSVFIWSIKGVEKPSTKVIVFLIFQLAKQKLYVCQPEERGLCLGHFYPLPESQRSRPRCTIGLVKLK